MKCKKVLIDNIPEEIKDRKQWVTWRYEKEGEKDTLRKPPINAKTGTYANPTDPNTWSSFSTALQRYEAGGYDGIGYVFSKDDPYVGTDLDECHDPETGEIESWALDVIKAINSYTEVSPSGTGIKIIAKGKLSGRGRKSGQIEMYDNAHYFTITGQRLDSFPRKLNKRPKSIKKLYDKFFKDKPSEAVTDNMNASDPLSDEDIISRAKNAKNGKRFKRLWKGDWEYFKSQSEADLALCGMLAYWTGRDRMKIESLFCRSGLMRKKWEKRSDYRERTIDQAISSCHEVYKPKPNQDVKKKTKDLLKSLKKYPKSAVKNILNNKRSINLLVSLHKHEQSQFEAFLQELKGIKVTVRDIGSLRRSVTSEAKKNRSAKYIGSIEQTKQVTVKSVLHEAPVSDALIIPNGWRVSDKGVFKEKTGKSRDNSDEIQLEEIAPSPIFIQGHLKNITDGTEDIRIIWFDGNKWISHTANRVDIADAKLLVKISDYGCPVTSATATSMVRYLAAFEAANKNHLPQSIATYQLGWQGERGKGGFLWGQNLITSSGDVMMNKDIEKMSPDEWPEKLIFFKGRDVGEDQISKGFHKKGKFVEWLKVVSIFKRYPFVTFSIYSALASPLLMILDESNFVVDWAFPTSRGKTTTLKVAASCWGNPDQRSPTSVVRSWDQTRVYSERALIAQRDLPLILDDTKRAAKPEMVSKIIYDISSGQGRGRGSIQGARDTGSWRTIALSNGESKATSFTIADGGTYARVLSIWGSPFGKKDKRKATIISEITKTIHINYGHAGYRFIRYLMKNRKNWKSWKERYSKLLSIYQNKAGSNEVALRQCSFFAVIHLTAILAKKALDLPIDYKKHLPKVFKKAIAETSGADRAKEALQEVLSWVISNKDSFWTPGGGSSTKQPLGGWLGVWNPDSNAPVKTKSSGKKSNKWDENDTNSNLESVAFMPNQLHKYLKAEGYEAKTIIRTWKDKKWIDISGEEKGLTKKVSIDGERPRCYVITREAIKIVED